MEFDVYNESDYYTYLYVGVGGNGWYPQTGGDILLLPNASKHVVVPIADMARDIDVSNVDWLEFEPETLVEEENYQGKTKTYPLGPPSTSKPPPGAGYEALTRDPYHARMAVIVLRAPKG